MGFWTAFFAISFYLATLLFVGGVIYRIYQYATTPAPLKVPTMPAPMTQKGVIVRVLSEVVLFRSLFRSNKWIWLLGMMFHGALLLVIVRHLRYFTEPVWSWVALAQPFGKYGGLVMLLGLLGLLGRRIVIERIRYISNPSDYLMLILLLVIGTSGALMSFVTHIDIIHFKAFMLSVMYLDVFSGQYPIPIDTILLVHLASVIVLMIIFPFSKLLHAPGVFFSPSRNQVDNSREKRHVAPWALELETPKN
ncbi:MAG: respiratory nitrate reductase subunit gamma [Thiomargarita sp.]|nr:respiratory nitrate reductase subunit gamma [Thiomargarita sp.]